VAHFLSLDRHERVRVLGKPWAMVTVELASPVDRMPSMTASA